jgi:hypothetical protein
MPGTVGVTFKLWGADTGGAVSMGGASRATTYTQAQRQRYAARRSITQESTVHDADG